jgi:hypothetical protein
LYITTQVYSFDILQTKGMIQYVSIQLLKLNRLQCAGNVSNTSSEITLHDSLFSVFIHVLYICKQVSRIIFYPQLNSPLPLQNNRKLPASTASNNSFPCLQYSTTLPHPKPVQSDLYFHYTVSCLLSHLHLSLPNRSDLEAFEINVMFPCVLHSFTI